ncbi:MAG TPA: ABC transporter permease [Bryobacteraceae bacterium]|jgi:predicted permease|nr:ABC transporter permease [Bryobacteraceae bacterium]
MTFRFALRQLRKSPGFTSVAVLSLALGIGANTAIFSVMDALLLRTLPIKHPDQLVLFGEGISSGIFNPFPNGNNTDLYSPPFFRQLHTEESSFAGVAAMESMPAEPHARLSGASELEALKLRVVSGNYFQVLGVGASLGRVLTADDDVRPGGHPVAVLSHAFWERRFAHDPSVIGRTLAFNSTVFTIIGVATPGFSGTVVGESPDAWVPLAMLGQVMPWIQAPWDDWSQSLWLFARLRPGVGISAAQTNANVLYQQWLHQVSGSSPSPERVADMRKARFPLTSAANGTSHLRKKYSLPLKILMALVGLVLLAACSNIANLLLARGGGRQREIAVRLALGARRSRLVAQLVSESLLLGLAGGALGVLIAWWGGELLLSLVSGQLDVGPNSRALLFTFGLSLLTGLLFGVLPALRMTRIDVGPALKEGKGTGTSKSRSRIGHALVSAQVALALFLTISAGVFIGTLRNLERINPGFDQDRVIVAGLDTDWTAFTRAAWLNVSRRVETRVKALPGVEAASFALVTFNGGSWMASLWPAGQEHTRANERDFNGNRVGADYFKVMGIPIIAGRTFSPRDTEQSQHVAVVNQTLARQVFGSEPALGRHFSLAGRDHYDFEIVGVVRDAHYDSLRETPEAMWFLYTQQEPQLAETLVVRTRGNPTLAMPLVRAAVRAEDPNLAISDIATLRSAVRDSLSREALLAKLAGFFGALALLLASVGLYGVMAYSVARRTNEIGIRMALGAQPNAVLGMVLRESLFVVGLGLIMGIPAALACGRYVSSQLYGLAPNDPATIAGASAVLLAVSLVASFLPARRAAMLDPLAALREE